MHHKCILNYTPIHTIKYIKAFFFLDFYVYKQAGRGSTNYCEVMREKVGKA